MMLRALFSSVFILFFIVACSSNDSSLYRHSPSMEPLEIPPDLTQPQVNDTYQIPRIGGGLMAQPLKGKDQKVLLQRDGALRWIEFRSDREVVWRRTREFWIDKGIKLEWENRSLGIMETAWIEHSASKFAKDRFRLRLEPGRNNDTTELYLSHRGIQQEYLGEVTASRWIKRPNDPELEIEILANCWSI
ncbi:MAG: outer membrane protein assembly factor BamC [Gammaproteobacteria bacterium]|nr:outer membrane protein assembly factor BamC [Gammaproteobacteria bacterium]